MDDIDINSGAQAPHNPPNSAPPLPPDRPPQDDPFVGMEAQSGAPAPPPTQNRQGEASGPIFPAVTPTNDAEFAMSEQEKQGDQDVERTSLACIIGLSLVSFVTMIQASIECDRKVGSVKLHDCKDEYGYAVAVAVISLVITFAFLISYRFCMRERVLKAMPYVAAFLTVWWGFGVGVCTFKEPFNATGNGYFALWAGFFGSFYLTTLTVTRFKDLVGRAKERAMAGSQANKCLLLIAVLSATVMVAAAVDANERNLGDSEEATPQESWGLACSIVSFLLVLIWFFIEYLKQNRGWTNPIRPGWFAAFLSLWWLFGVAVLTFDAPFTMTGNGYFATWGAFGASLYLCYLFFMKSPSGPGEQEGPR